MTLMRSLLIRRLEIWAVMNLSLRQRRRRRARAALAACYLSGIGMEIGALHDPLRVPEGVKVLYVDYLDQPRQRALYPELAWVKTVPVDIIDDGETLQSVGDASVDFLIANHVIEHCENPIQALKIWLGVIRHGGVLYMAVPDKLMTFDSHRALTSIEHLIADYRHGPMASRREHLRDLHGLTNDLPDNELEKYLASQGNAHPHYHVWTMASFRAMLDSAANQLGLRFVVEDFKYLDAEFVVVMRKI